MTLRVSMTPHPDDMAGKEHSGIAQVVINWARYLPKYDIEIVAPGLPADISIGHVVSNMDADIHVSHGLLWTEEMNLGKYAYEVNADLVKIARTAHTIITPSDWVADVYRRDMHKNVYVVWHGINPDEWKHNYRRGDYVLYTKNRTSDGLDPGQINDVARAMPHTTFYTTFATRDSPPNVVTYGGTVPFEEMKRHIQEAGVVFMPDRETWGIAAAEALASGVPVCSTNAGAVKDFVEHGVTGYIYRDHNLNDAIQGIKYCLKNASVLGENGKFVASSRLDWKHRVHSLAGVIQKAAYDIANRDRIFEAGKADTVAVVITSHNYGHVVDKAIESAVSQTHKPDRVIVVDDSSDDSTTEEVVKSYRGIDSTVEYLRVDYRNVALARNAGIFYADCRFIVVLDGDDWIKPDFVKDCLKPLMEDKTVGFSYSSSEVIDYEKNGEHLAPPGLAEQMGMRAHKPWPTMDVDKQFTEGMANQFPACVMFRKKALEQEGGYMARYAPAGAGTEDANLYLRLLAHGWKPHMVKPTPNNLWVHTHGEGHVSGAKGFEEVDWRAWQPYTRDFKFPFAAVATPKNLSHPVRSYEPKVSIIIPVGEGHEVNLATALHSVEAQEYRNWEAIVVWDFDPGYEVLKYYADAFPFVRFDQSFAHDYWTFAPMAHGPGQARNIGVRRARADFITFLDADDYYGPEFLTHVNPEVSREHKAIIYSKSYSLMRKDMLPRLTGNVIKEVGDNVVVDYNFRPYDQERAMTRPEGDRPYVWTGINILLPKMWHEAIGGFDENIKTWEDCLYLYRLAWQGYPFHRVDKPLWVYSFIDGARRDKSIGHEGELIAYLQREYDMTFNHERDMSYAM